MPGVDLDLCMHIHIFFIEWDVSCRSFKLLRLIDTLLQSASDRTFIAEYSSMQMQVNNIWALISRPDINEQSRHSPQSEEDQWNILTKR